MISSSVQAIPHERSGVSAHTQKSTEHFEAEGIQQLSEKTRSGSGISKETQFRNGLSSTGEAIKRGGHNVKQSAVSSEGRKYSYTGCTGQHAAHVGNMELADTLHGFEGRCLDMIGRRKWKSDTKPFWKFTVKHRPDEHGSTCPRSQR